MTPTVTEKDTNQALRDALIAYLESGETDTEALCRLQALPEGLETLERALTLRKARAHFHRGGATVEEFLQEKQAEREAEAERDRRSDALHA